MKGMTAVIGAVLVAAGRGLRAGGGGPKQYRQIGGEPVIRLSLRVRDELIAEIRFKAKGCVPAMACGSALTELTRGRTVAEARKLKRDDLIAAVGGVPPASSHAAQLALDALAMALNQIAANRKP